MSPQAPASGRNIAVIVGIAIIAWYLYQIGSRKKERVRYKIKRIVVALAIYLVAALVLNRQGLPPLEAVVVGLLAGLGCAWLLINPPRSDRRIPAAVRREVIARDLTSKGLKWDPAKYHIDHMVPFSRGGDNSPRNLRVIERHKNSGFSQEMMLIWHIAML
jgi:hypothetical protein